MADSVTQVRVAGPVGAKKNLAVLGDGFAAGDHGTYDTWVEDVLLAGVFGNDYFHEDASAWNVFRVNLESNDSGVTQRVYDEQGTPNDPSDDTITSTTARDTALDFVFSGSWSHCWLEYGANTESRLQAALATWVPDYDFVLIVLNEAAFGGCGGGGRAHVTRGGDWTLIAHEFGHGMGGLADEYCRPRAYTGGEPGAVNVTVNPDRATTKWGAFIAPATPAPTGVGACAGYTEATPPAGWDDDQDVGLFEGGSTFDTGIYRPVINCRMRGNAPPFCPVCYTQFKRAYDDSTGHTFRHCYAGDFNGDGRSDVLVHDGNSIQVFTSTGAGLQHASSAVGQVPGSWQFQPGDRFHVGDFDGDGKDEVVVFNGADWVMPYLGLLADDGAGGLRLIARYDGDVPGWGGLAAGDRFVVADFDGDGRQDLLVFNGTDWSMTYVGMLRSTGAGFTLVRRFDGDIPGWGGLAPGDQLFAGDFSGEGRDDLFVFNGADWSMTYVGMFRSSGSDLILTQRYDGDIPGWGGLAPGDQLFVGDVDVDGLDDLFVFNGADWAMSYLGVFRSERKGLSLVARYDGDVPGWGGLARNDRFLVADLTGDGRSDLLVVNTEDWVTEYLGRLLSHGTGLTGSFAGDWVGEWNLGGVDRYESCSVRGEPGRPDVFVHNTDWFGIINLRDGFSLQRIYHRWIHDYRHGRNW